MNFINWDIYQLNNFGEECVIMLGLGWWSDISCIYVFNIICEMRYKQYIFNNNKWVNW